MRKIRKKDGALGATIRERKGNYLIHYLRKLYSNWSKLLFIIISPINRQIIAILFL